ncbi:hypothetical protein [Streptomyces sp. NBC_01451]|nr:hypothetical protein [Streptomyces sp. NBC_01451]
MNENPAPVILTELTDDRVILITLNRPERHNWPRRSAPTTTAKAY